MLKLDLQFFSEGEEDFDLEAFRQEFEAEWEEGNEDGQAEEDVQEETDESTEEPEQTEEEVEESGESEEQEDLDPNAEDEQKRNKAFQEMRKQVQENEKYAKFVQQIAEQNGVSPDEILQRFQDRQLEQQAEKENVPVDVLKRLNSLEEENKSIKERTTAERFDSQVDNVIKNYNASEDEIRATFEYMGKSGIDPRKVSVDFEAMYRAANLDSIIEKRVNESRQKELEEKQKRQQTSAIPSGNSVSQTEEWSDDAVMKELEKRGISI